MNHTTAVLDDLSQSLSGAEGELTRRTLETLALDSNAFKIGSQSKRELPRAMVFATGFEVDGFLKAHRVLIEYDEHELARGRSRF